MNDQYPADPSERVIVVGAGPVGCTAALLLADSGIPVTLLERHPQPHPLPRAVHLDDEVTRTLHRDRRQRGLPGPVPARQRAAPARRPAPRDGRVPPRPRSVGRHGFPQANMFHQPDLEELLLARVEPAPADRLPARRRGRRAGRRPRPAHRGAGRVVARPRRRRRRRRRSPGASSSGCDGANSTIRELVGDHHGRTSASPSAGSSSTSAPTDDLDTWDGVEQVCDPARAATFMQVTGDRYRWEFQLQRRRGRGRPDHAGHARPPAASPGPGADDLDGLEIIRSAVYTFRARIASRFQVGPGLPARRRRPPHPAVHRPGPGRRAARRRQPGLEDRPRAHRPRRRRPCSTATTPSAARTPRPW